MFFLSHKCFTSEISLFLLLKAFLIVDELKRTCMNNFQLAECDLRCGICGAEEESIYHVIFECPPALQTWALSRIPSPPGIFSSSSVFTSLDHLFWRLPTDVDSEYFPWIMWYIWKNKNDKIHNNRTVSPQEILRRADVEGSLWAEAQLLV